MAHSSKLYFIFTVNLLNYENFNINIAKTKSLNYSNFGNIFGNLSGSILWLIEPLPFKLFRLLTICIKLQWLT